MTVYPPDAVWIVALAAAILAVHAYMAGQALARALIRWADRRWPRRAKEVNHD